MHSIRLATRLLPSIAMSALLLTAACKGKRGPDATPDDAPGLAKVAEQQGDATKQGHLQKDEPHESSTKPLADIAPEKDVADEASKGDADHPKDDEKSADDSDGTSGDKSDHGDKSDDASSNGEERTTKIHVKRIQFSEQIQKREPVAAEETFSAAQIGKLYAFVELDNPEKKRSHVQVTFIPPIGNPSKVELRVGDKSRWRTWALRRSVKAVGTWTVVVTDAKGAEIGRRTFEVTE